MNMSLTVRFIFCSTFSVCDLLVSQVLGEILTLLISGLHGMMVECVPWSHGIQGIVASDWHPSKEKIIASN